jgi:HSP20 family molecular chaperone IbpA
MPLMCIRARVVDSLAAQVEAIQQRITSRANEIWRDRGASLGRALDDWLHAEHEIVWRPAVEVRRLNGAFIVEAAVAGLEPSQLDVQASSDELLLAATLHHGHPSPEDEVVTCEFANGPLFRSLRFPEPIDPTRVKGEIRNGLLRVTAPLAGRSKVGVAAA